MKEIGLLDRNTSEDVEATINFLFSTALEKIAFFPFAYIMDKWRWDVFDGTTSAADYNCHWWHLRLVSLIITSNHISNAIQIQYSMTVRNIKASDLL